MNALALGCLLGFFSAGVLAQGAPGTPPLSVDVGGTAPFDVQLVGTTTTGQFYYSSTGPAVAVNGATVVGANSTSYAIVADTCTGGLILQGSVRCEVDVNFTPQQLSDVFALLVLNTNAGPYNYQLTGSGLAAPFLVSPTVIDFGFQPFNTLSAPQNIVVKNPNPVPVRTDFDYYGIYQSTTTFDFVDHYNCGSIPAFGACTIQVTFQPSTAGPEYGQYFIPTQLVDGHYQQQLVTILGSGVSDGATSVDLSAAFNVTGNSDSRVPTQNGGLDGLGDAYDRSLISTPLTWAGQQFTIGFNPLNAVSAATIALPQGDTHAITFLGTAVRGNQLNQVFTIHYTDGSSTIARQSLSDWRTPQHFAGEAIAATYADRVGPTGAPHTGPYYLYAYSLPVDHTKSVASIKLPNNRSVVALAVNLEPVGVPAIVDLSPFFNVDAIYYYVPIDGPGIDGLGNAISYTQLQDASSPADTIFSLPRFDLPNGVANTTVGLPSFNYGSLTLLALGTRGNHPNQTLTVHYKDGTTGVLQQSFSDWHTPQHYPNEAVAIAMPSRLAKDGTAHAGTYNVYQYKFVLDASKPVASLELPKNNHVVVLSVSLEE